jgi:hypothetical protein
VADYVAGVGTLVAVFSAPEADKSLVLLCIDRRHYIHHMKASLSYLIQEHMASSCLYKSTVRTLAYSHAVPPIRSAGKRMERSPEQPHYHYTFMTRLRSSFTAFEV